nr:hypothetical protein [Neobacillus sp. 179.-C4.2 HS]
MIENRLYLFKVKPAVSKNGKMEKIINKSICNYLGMTGTHSSLLGTLSGA